MATKEIAIESMQYGDAMWSKTADYAMNCSFQDTGQYLSALMRENAFDDFERIFCACIRGDIIGFCGLVKESCSENDTNTPWLDFLFVDHEYRNQGVARKLVRKVMDYAKSIDFHQLYLCTASHEMMYEKWGFYTVYDTHINEHTAGKVMKIDL